eukprot:scaffold74453_cov50-Phaeocystis_antarctica.AAC.1
MHAAAAGGAYRAEVWHVRSVDRLLEYVKGWQEEQRVSQAIHHRALGDDTLCHPRKQRVYSALDDDIHDNVLCRALIDKAKCTKECCAAWVPLLLLHRQLNNKVGSDSLHRRHYQSGLEGLPPDKVQGGRCASSPYQASTEEHLLRRRSPENVVAADHAPKSSAVALSSRLRKAADVFSELKVHVERL